MVAKHTKHAGNCHAAEAMRHQELGMASSRKVSPSNRVFRDIQEALVCRKMIEDTKL